MIDTAAESALLAARVRLHALGVPADDLPDDLVPVAAGGSLMPSLPGWTPARARNWAAIAVRWPAVARRVVEWTEANAGRLANLEAILFGPGPHPFPPGRISFRLVRTDLKGSDLEEQQFVQFDSLAPEHPDVSTGLVEHELEVSLRSLNHMPRPWHAGLTAAIAAARRGDIRPGTLVTIDAAHPSYACDCPAVTRLRILDDAVAAHLTAHVRRTNAGPFCGAGPRELLLDGMRTDNIGGDARRQIRLSYEFRFRPGSRWDRFLDSNGAWREMVDHRGRSMFEPADFFELP
jgi:hypothetical protein